jgi:hypothetical protein
MLKERQIDGRMAGPRRGEQLHANSIVHTPFFRACNKTGATAE